MAKQPLIRIPIGNILVSATFEPDVYTTLWEDLQQIAPAILKRQWITGVTCQNGEFSTPHQFMPSNWDESQRARDLLILSSTDAIPARLILESVFYAKRTVIVADYDNRTRSYDLYNWRLFKKQSTNPRTYFAFDYGSIHVIPPDTPTQFSYAELILGRTCERHS